ncbi:hypothetical protein [Microvirga sp. M2]|uniref:hypothetical protein n=1 Tax=Microvirga sp. M2 TaxID=3073270 RepID=UPI0039C040F8
MPGDDGSIRQHYVLIAVRCRWLSGAPLAADDALEARWFSLSELDPATLPMSADVDVIARQAEAMSKAMSQAMSRQADGL